MSRLHGNTPADFELQAAVNKVEQPEVTQVETLKRELAAAERRAGGLEEAYYEQSGRLIAAEQRAESMRKDAAMWCGFQALINATDKTFSINRGQLAYLITQMEPLVDKSLAEGEKK